MFKSKFKRDRESIEDGTPRRRGGPVRAITEENVFVEKLVDMKEKYESLLQMTMLTVSAIY